jgi:phage tail sheath protein FI
MLGWDEFSDPEQVDVNLLLAGAAASEDVGLASDVQRYVVQSVAEARKDCVAFVSPPKTIVVGRTASDAVSDLQNWRTGQGSYTSNNFNVNSSYGMLDGNFKYMYDKYNDKYRWVPLAGDIAGLCVVTDNQRDPWWSPGGLTRGRIKGVVKLAFTANKGHRDQLYKSPYGINPIVSMPGKGTVLWGDKTTLTKPSAFDRINVRRLFIVLEKSIATASQYTLFEFNDEYTRNLFKGMVEPFMNDVKGRRGVYDFKVVCDESNNTGEVIDRNEFVADIYIKPTRSINYISLNFVATKTGVEFSELFGQV